MATITVRNLDEGLKRDLQIRSAKMGRSMEAEVRAILKQVVQSPTVVGEEEEDLGTAIHKLFAPLGGVDLPIPPRTKSSRPIPTFD